MNQKSNFQRVAAMNKAFGNPAGDASAVDWARIRKQCKNIQDELVELYTALGADPVGIKDAAETVKWFLDNPTRIVRPLDVRDALCDINVFSYGAHHLMGHDADEDMSAVLGGVMTRFVKNADDKAATIKKHAEKGVTDVYFEGEYPTMIMKSAKDQPDAPKGKFLKSASYREPVFPEPTAAKK
jgi:predicted HAD superfamily Cof-like phosphohydrolase